MVTLNHIAGVAVGGGNQTGSTGDQSYTTGRRVVLVGLFQRISHGTGLGSHISISDDADDVSGNDITWSDPELSSLFGATDNEIQIGIWTSSELTANETFDITADARDPAFPADLFRYRFQIYEETGGDGTLAQAAAFGFATGTDDLSLALTTPTDAQIIATGLFGGGANSWDTAPTNFTLDDNTRETGGLSSETDTTDGAITYGKSNNTADYVGTRFELNAAATSFTVSAHDGTSLVTMPTVSAHDGTSLKTMATVTATP